MAIEEISVQDLVALGAAAQIVDVREIDEWTAGHIEHAVHIPLGAVPERLSEFQGSPCYVICRSGGRSTAACELAAGQGHDVVNVAGGMLAWIEAGFDFAGPAANG